MRNLSFKLSFISFIINDGLLEEQWKEKSAYPFYIQIKFFCVVALSMTF